MLVQAIWSLPSSEQTAEPLHRITEQLVLEGTAGGHLVLLAQAGSCRAGSELSKRLTSLKQVSSVGKLFQCCHSRCVFADI